MQINTQLPPIISSLTPGVPNPVETYKSPLEGKNTKGTISVTYTHDRPVEIKIEFEPKQKTEFPFANAGRVISINFRTNRGTLTRKAYVTNNGEQIPEATAEFRSDAEYNADGRKPPLGLLESVLGQIQSVQTFTPQYNDIANLPIIKAYSEGDRRQLTDELDKLRKSK